MNEYTIYFIRWNAIPANKTISATNEQDAIAKFANETNYKTIVKIEKI